jgi:hypothetical protein
MNEAIATAHKANGFIYLPANEINDGLKLKSLAAVGIKVLGQQNETAMCPCQLPEGWSSIEAPESPLQLRLIDESFRLRAKIFYKVGSQGGGASLEVFPRYSIVLKTPDRARWAEVYDGNTLIYCTKRTAWVDRMEEGWEAITEHEQPEYIAAEQYLASRFPYYKNPLAYWD